MAAEAWPVSRIAVASTAAMTMPIRSSRSPSETAPGPGERALGGSGPREVERESARVFIAFRPVNSPCLLRCALRVLRTQRCGGDYRPVVLHSAGRQIPGSMLTLAPDVAIRQP